MTSTKKKKGDLVGIETKHSKGQAKEFAASYRRSGRYSARIYERWIRVDGAAVRLWCVVVRRKPELVEGADGKECAPCAP